MSGGGLVWTQGAYSDLRRSFNLVREAKSETIGLSELSELAAAFGASVSPTDLADFLAFMQGKAMANSAADELDSAFAVFSKAASGDAGGAAALGPFAGDGSRSEVVDLAQMESVLTRLGGARQLRRDEVSDFAAAARACGGELFSYRNMVTLMMTGVLSREHVRRETSQRHVHARAIGYGGAEAGA
ncbi:uncharacterized protein AMSG_10707 [Thecamonas trahens ATCC 50062]|uniref:Uncharacterized protein n=1 Tax=Thecamonas trahens ATCC 50062 TaxID=461836 RepID=A0A0L0DUH7_THETB|nr:hypothetical protein AMSG_10707 [Thecamonas trahens ATCC 50062]KNC55108.1 hypothetical protein AMSG_10707 [Thecamonas trahens ATCC 50062]|eukprot:XP_013753291.1 hypothetical protein AMSG_10707 [Thecamonas trahens ATCC 50062]